MIAKLNFDFAIRSNPASINTETRHNVADTSVTPATTLYDITKLTETLNPLDELERYLCGVVDFAPMHRNGEFTETEKRFFNFNFWLSHNQQHDPEWSRVRLIPVPEYHEKALSLVWTIRQRYDACSFNGKYKTKLPWLARFRNLYWWLWYTVLGLNVERINENDHWLEMMECSCCSVQLENVSVCIQVLAGQWVEDRDSFLAKLRPHFSNHVNRLAGIAPTCDCSEGLTQ